MTPGKVAIAKRASVTRAIKLFIAERAIIEENKNVKISEEVFRKWRIKPEMETAQPGVEKTAKR